MNLSSTSVKVFPSTYRVSELSGKYTSEKNFANIINSIVDYTSSCPGYTLSYSDNNIKFILHGYYFDIDLNKTYSNLYATIAVETSSGCLVNCDTGTIDLDIGGTFRGLNLTESSPAISITGCSIYTLQLLSNGTLVNKAKISSDTVRYKNETRSVSEVLDGKQATLSVSDPLSMSNNTLLFDQHTGSHGKYVKYAEQISKGASDKPIYTNGSGELVASTSSVGTRGNVSGATIKSQAMIISNGTLTGGQTIFASTASPTSSDGQVGDLWLKYSN